MKKRQLKVLFCTSEIVPFSKTGGLADVCGILPVFLKKQGVDIRIATPFYSRIIKNNGFFKKDFKTIRGFSAKQSFLNKDIAVYLIEKEKYFNRNQLYGNSKGEYKDNLERFAFYCREVLELLKKIDFKPDIIHCNEWHTALIPLYLKTVYKDDKFLKDIKTIFTIHNMAYQGIFSVNDFRKIGIDKHFEKKGNLKSHQHINLMKTALIFSDHITAVSHTYANEIKTKEYGCDLENVVRKRKNSLTGILNGIDYNEWDPKKDRFIYKKYSYKDITKKLVNKISLQKECGFEVDADIPVFAVISRLCYQKGLEILADVLYKMLEDKKQFILLGTGEHKYYKLFKKIRDKYTKKMFISFSFNNVLAHKIYAGADMFLMPSRYEPCGLSQLISLKYGTVPVVRDTGGLSDTMIDYTKDPKKGNAFVFKKYSSAALLNTINRAIRIYEKKNKWSILLKRIMMQEFRWCDSAEKYVSLYKKVIC